MKTPAIQLKNVTKKYGSSRGITNINLTVEKGEVFGFIGPNGAGKTTAIRMILDFIRVSEGQIKVLGLDSKHDSLLIRKRVGYLSGNLSMDKQLTGRQYLEYISNVRGGVSWSSIEKLATRLQCELDKKIGSLSRGNQQKIGLVSALMHDPDILILDEPTSGLDPLIQAEFSDLIQEHRKRGKTTFISSHVLSEVQELCDRIGFIKEGELLTVQSLKSLQKQAFKRATITLSKKAPKSILDKVANTRDVKIHDKTVVCHVTGEFTPLIKALSAYKVTDLLVEEPSLEDLFMAMYSGKEQKNV